jgi:adenine-specific DNA-methyltransferase
MSTRANRTRLELTWIGKQNRPKLEPRVLIEDPDKSYHAAHRVSENDLFDNRLIFGDNLLALKALEQEFTGKIKCIYIDPPFNTGQAFDHYEDGIEHSLWLSLMRDRLELLRRLLTPDGTIWVHLDDNEVHYLKVMMDDLFGRRCFISSVAWRAADSSNNDAKQFSIDHNTILAYSREPGWLSYSLPRTDESNAHYSNPDNDPRGPWFMGNVSSPHPRENLRYEMPTPSGKRIPCPHNGWRWSIELAMEKIASGQIVFVDDETRLIHKTYLADQKGLAPSSIWHDITQTGHNRQAKYELKKLFPDTPTTELFSTPKPERLIQRILMIATQEGDCILDSFAGSGTTGAVAHKMRRRWIMVELGEHCHDVIIPRMKRVIDGTDRGGVTDATDWGGGGGFRYCRLGPSLIVEDEWGNPVINPEFNAGMLAEAMCKVEGFTFDPNAEVYWQQGRSSETDFIYVTTQFMSKDMLVKISDEVGPNRSLLICCSAFRCNVSQFENLTVKKIPKAVLKKCEWGHDDYSLEIENLPDAPPEVVEQREAEAAVNRKPVRKFGKDKDHGQMLFNMDTTDSKGGK